MNYNYCLPCISAVVDVVRCVLSSCISLRFLAFLVAAVLIDGFLPFFLLCVRRTLSLIRGAGCGVICGSVQRRQLQASNRTALVSLRGIDDC